MATVDTRAYSKNYSGLLTETYLALAIAGICTTSFELMRHRRRKTKAYEQDVAAGRSEKELGSVESWEFGYLFQGRCWAKRPSPPLPKYPLAWVKQMIMFSEPDLLPLVGPDTTVYARFLRGSWYYCLLHMCTTLPILLPIHLHYAPPSNVSGISNKSMTRVSLSNLVASPTGKKLLPIHLCLLLWITLSWIGTLLWIIRGAFRYRRQQIVLSAEQATIQDEARKQMNKGGEREADHLRGWRIKTIMVTNIPAALRDEKILKEYFEFYLARVKASPPPAPGLVEGVVSFVSRFWQARSSREKGAEAGINEADESGHKDQDHAIVGIEKVVIVRKMHHLTSLLERREEVLRKLEEAHIHLAQAALKATAEWLEAKERGGKDERTFLQKISRKKAAVRITLQAEKEKTSHDVTDIEMARSSSSQAGDEHDEERMNELAQALRPYLEEFGMLSSPHRSITSPRSWIHKPLVTTGGQFGSPTPTDSSDLTHAQAHGERPSVWEVLYHIPRYHVDAFQPLVRLKSLFRGAHVPAIDYYTTKLGLLTSLITEQRSQPPSSFPSASTAFVTFSDPENARKAVKLLPSHPKNPLSCLAEPAPEFGDIDWGRLMKSTFTGEFLRNWVVDFGVWFFTLIWILPVSSIVTLVSINNIGNIWPALRNYLVRNPTAQDLITNLLPTLLVTGLAILIPLILLLIAKKAHNIVLLSKLHDQILTRYYKFLVCNVLIFFCVGVSALQSFLTVWKQVVNPLPTIAARFPDAAPFYVGWFIFTTAMHSGLELGLLGLPLIVYRSTVLHATTPSKRKAGTRPRTFNFYYWLPNHLIVLFVGFTFALLNPLVIPFQLFYFSIILVVFKHQFLHVYSKAYEMNAKVLLIRIQRYSLDGIILAQVIFFALMVILKETTLAVFTGLFFGCTGIFKMLLTRWIRYNFAQDAVFEAELLCGSSHGDGTQSPRQTSARQSVSGERDSLMARWSNFLHTSLKKHHDERELKSAVRNQFWTWRKPFEHGALPARNRNRESRGPIPFDVENAADVQRAVSEEKRVEHQPAAADLSHKAPPLREEIARDQIADGPRTVRHSSQMERYLHQKHGLVIRHERRLPWDDAPRLDIPYENPAFTTPVENVLWLPTNPCARLDLDDTVLMFRAITSEVEGGTLGQWEETSSVFVEPPGTQRLAGEGVQDDLEANGAEEPRHLTGSERIVFSPGIGSRVESLGKRRSFVEPDDSEDAASYFGKINPLSKRRSSFLSTASNQVAPAGRSFSIGTVASSTQALRPVRSQTSALNQWHPAYLSAPTPRAFSGGSTTTRGRLRSESVATSHYSQSPVDPLHPGPHAHFADSNLSPVLSRTSQLAESPGEEIDIPIASSPLPLTPLHTPPLPQAEGQTSLGIGRPVRRPSSLAPADPNVAGPSRVTSGGRPRAGSRASISARDAVVGEVLAEEQKESADQARKMDEEHEQERGGSRRWWSAWLYHNHSHHEDDK